jgi:hypothetical protein
MTAGELIVQGNGKGADIVPPSLDQAREFARHSKAQNTLRGIGRTGGTSAFGASRTR